MTYVNLHLGLLDEMQDVSSTNMRSRHVLNEMRQRLQSAHFAARGMSWLERSIEREPVADQLHTIRVLAEQLDELLGSA